MFPLKKLFIIFTLPIVVLALHAILIPLNIYDLYPWFDIPMHFLGGLAVAISYFSLLRFYQSAQFLGKTNKAIFFLFVISLVALTAVLWEFLEFTIDMFFPFVHAQAGLPDTILDLFLGLIGGIVGFLSSYKKQKVI